MHQLAPGSASRQQCLLLLLTLLCLALQQAGSAQSFPDPMCSVPAEPPPALRSARGNFKGWLAPVRLLPRNGLQRLGGRLPYNTTLENEGATYSWLYEQIFNLLGWAPCPLSTPKPYPEPVGWKLVAVLNITASYGGALTQVPTAAVLRPANLKISKQLVVVIRESAFDENRIIYDYTQVADAAYGKGLIHRGFRNATDELWGDASAGLQALLQEYVVNATTDGISKVLIAGHSMGGGLATLLAARAQKYLVDMCYVNGSRPSCKFMPITPRNWVDMVAFAACNIGDSAFAADFNKRVNSRLVDFASDRVTKFLTSFFAPPEWPVPDTAVSYKRVAGVLRFSAHDMRFQPNVWRNISQGVSSIDPAAPPGVAAFEAWADAQNYQSAMGLTLSRGTLYAAAAHVCSYKCMLSAYVAGAKREWCMLHDDAPTLAQAKASYCGNFPPYAIASVFPTVPAYP